MKNYVFAFFGALTFVATSSFFFNRQTEDVNRSPAHYGWRKTPPAEPAPAAEAAAAVPRTILSGLHCEFSAGGFADAVADYDPVTNTVTATWGDPPTTQQFSGITLLTGLPPYNANGVSLIAFGDSPLFHVTFESSDGTFPATWGQIPGGPTNVLNAGTCTLKSTCTPGDDGEDNDDGDDHDDGGKECKNPRHHHKKKHKHDSHKRH